jgi:heterotetrameric sarcosine oxidase gamma subunit
VSAPERRAAFSGQPEPGLLGATGTPSTTLRVLARDAVEISARRGEADALRSRLQPGTPEVAPGRLFVTGPRGAPGALAERLEADLAGIASVVDLSGGLVAIAFEGPSAAAALAKGCRLDLHDSVWPPGAIARTVIAQVPVTIIRQASGAGYDLYVPLSLAGSFVHHLVAAAAEYGCRVLDPEGEPRS